MITISQAETLFEIRDYQKALEAFDKMIGQSSDPYSSTLMKGVCCYKLRLLDRAKAELEECDRIRPHDSRHKEYQVKLAIVSDELDQAMLLVNKLTKSASNEHHYYILKAKIERLKGDVEAGIDSLNTALRLSPQSYKVYKELGNCYFDTDYEESLKYFTRAAEINSSDVFVVDRIGFIYMRMEQYGKALDIFKRAMEVNPSDKRHYYLIGLCHMKLGQKTEGLECLKIAVSIDSSDPNVYFIVGVTEREVGEFNEAIVALQKSIDTGNSENVHEKYNEIGLCYLNLKDTPQAIEFFKKSVEMNSDYAVGYSNLGLALYLSKNYKLAKEALMKAVELDEELRDAYNNLGLVYIALENYKDAERCYNKIAIYNEYRYDALIKLGTIKLRRKKYGEAKHYFKIAAALNDVQPIAFYNLGLVYSDLRKHQKARSNFIKALQCDPLFILAKKSIEKLDESIVIERYQRRESGGCLQFLCR